MAIKLLGAWIRYTELVPAPLMPIQKLTWAARLASFGDTALDRSWRDSVVKLLDGGPIDCRREDINVVGSLCAEVHVIRVLVHIERENWRATRQCVAMVCRPLVDELAVAR